MSDIVNSMQCKACGSTNQRKFKAEMIIHPIGVITIGKSTAVWAGPELFVCLDCGTSEFVVPEGDIRLLQQAANAAA